MDVNEAVLGKFEKHIRELEQYTQIPSDWLWWDRRGRRFRKLAVLDKEILQDVLDLYYKKLIQPFEAYDVYTLTQRLGVEISKISQVIRSISRLSIELERIRNQQLTEINQQEEAHKLNLIIHTIDQHLKEILIRIATTLHHKDTDNICRQELQEFTKKLLQDPYLREGLTGVYAVGKILNNKTEDDLTILVTGRRSVLNEKGRVIASHYLRLQNNISKKLVGELLGKYGFKPKITLAVNLTYNDQKLFSEHMGEWIVLHERKLTAWEKMKWWMRP